MKVLPAAIPDVVILEPRVFEDERGFFLECWNARALAAALGFEVSFVQDNHSGSRRGVLRGLHYQIMQPQAKLIRVVRGRVFDVAVDLRRSSSAFGRWVGTELSAENRRLAFVPAGFAHGFLVLSEAAEVLYKTTDYYAPQHERCLIWNDPEVGVAWPLTGEPVLAAKDRIGLRLREAETFE